MHPSLVPQTHTHTHTPMNMHFHILSVRGLEMTLMSSLGYAHAWSSAVNMYTLTYTMMIMIFMSCA